MGLLDQVIGIHGGTVLLYHYQVVQEVLLQYELAFVTFHHGTMLPQCMFSTYKA